MSPLRTLALATAARGWLRPRIERAASQLVWHVGQAERAGAAFDPVSAARHVQAAAAWGLVLCAAVPLANLVRSEPSRPKYASKSLRREAKRFRTGHLQRHQRWLAEGTR